LGKVVFAVCDRQGNAQKADIEAKIPYVFEAPEKGFEKVLLQGTAEVALRRYALGLVADDDWPRHLADKTPTDTMPAEELRDALYGYLLWSKGSGGAADLLGECSLEEMPKFIVDTLVAIQETVNAASTTKVVDVSQAEASPDPEGAT
jgi:putative ATP-dependent endonuclease of OLD family